MVYPVPAGREILQEAPICTLQVLLEAIHAAQARPIVAPLSRAIFQGDNVEERTSALQESADVIHGNGNKIWGLSSSLEIDEHVTEGDESCTYASARRANLATGTPTDCKTDGDSAAQIIHVGAASTASLTHTPNGATKKGRQARGLYLQKERAAERKAKNERLKRQQDLDRLKKTKRQQAEYTEQQQECVAMQEEDHRSKGVDTYIRQVNTLRYMYHETI